MKDHTVCWKIFTTGMPRTYSVPALVIRSWAAWYSAISCAFLPPIMANMERMETTAASRQAQPIRQSKTNIRASMATNRVMVPTMSARLWASSVSVSAAAASSRPRMRPEALASNQPSGASITWATPRLRMLAAVRNAARWVHIRPAKYSAIPPTSVANAIQPYRVTLWAAVQSGATSIRSRAASQIQM